MRTKSFTLFLFLFCLNSWAQDRYMVFFIDKAGSPYSIQAPEEFLSERALARRAKEQIVITEEDIPISPNYTQGLKDLGIDVYYSTKWMNGVLVQMDQNEAVVVQNLPYVTSIEKVAANAPLQQRALKRAEPLPGQTNAAIDQQRMLGIDLMHEYGLYGEGLLIGVFDDGFTNLSQLPSFQHILNEDRLLYSFDFVNNRENVENGEDHGTRVLSIIGANQFNYKGGVPNATFILSATEAPQEYRVEEYNWLFAAEKADSAGVDIINTSLGYKTGFTDPSMNYTNAQLDGETAVITRAANIAASKGIILVNSAGNSGSLVSAPADSPNVLAVGAIAADSLIASFSSKGTSSNVFKPDVVAQGVSTLLITSQGSMAAQNGTSFSAPMMTGLVAGVRQAYPGKTAAEIRDMIRAAGDRATNPDNVYGYGIPSFGRIIENERTLAAANSVIYSAYPNPTADDLLLRFDEKYFGELLTIQIINPNGRLKNQFEFVPFESRNPLKLELNESGIYFLRVISNSGTTSRKIIKY